MVINNQEIINALAVIAQVENVRVTLNTCTKSALIVGAMTFAGGLLLGPLGLALGGTLGGITSYAKYNDFRALSDVLMNDLSDEQQERLARHIQTIAEDFEAMDTIAIGILLLENKKLKQLALKYTLKFVTNELGMSPQKV